MAKQVEVVLDDGGRFLHIRHPLRAEDYVRFDCPESIAGGGKYKWRLKLRCEGRWRRGSDGSMSCDYRGIPAPKGQLKAGPWMDEDWGLHPIRLVPDETGVDISLQMNNRTNFDWQGVHFAFCVSFRNAPRFYPDAMKRTYMRVGGKWQTIESTDRRNGLEGKIMVYVLDGEPTPEYFHDRPRVDYGWGLGPERPDCDVIGMDSDDGQWTMAVRFDQANVLTFNVLGDHHGCIHSNPSVSSVPAGESVTVRGRVTFAAGRFTDHFI